MLLTVLGCRSGMPARGQASSGYLLETAGSRLLLDCGPGIATALSALAAPAALDAVVISHFHADHCYDLLPLGKSLLTAMAHGAAVADFAPVRLLVPSGSRALLDRWAGLFPVSTYPLLDKAFEIAFDVQEYEPGDRYRVGDCTVSLHELRHAVPNCGIRVETATATFAYTGDTGPTPALHELAADVDLLLAEATLAQPDAGPHGHLTGAEAGRAAAEAGARELVLTHFTTDAEEVLSATRDAAAGAYGGPVRVAASGARIKIGAL